MNILVVRLGYAGKRFLRSIRYLEQKGHFDTPLDVAHVSRSLKDQGLAYYPTVEQALKEFHPDIVIVAVNDENHAEILQQLDRFSGHVICEKPLVNERDNLEAVVTALDNVSGFTFDLIERYSPVSTRLRDYISSEGLRLLRANFHWGKDRINDRRPTGGATSEIIHALDLIQWLCPMEGTFSLRDVSGVSSDFSISGSDVLDTAMITGRMGKAVITGYSSFVNIVRQRTVDLAMVDRTGSVIYARMVFDTPNWDEDDLLVWRRDAGGQETQLLTFSTTGDRTGTPLHTISKLVCLCEDAIDQVQHGSSPTSSSADLKTAISLQKQLNEIDRRVSTTGPVKYVHTPERIFTQDESSLEGLG